MNRDPLDEFAEHVIIEGPEETELLVNADMLIKGKAKRTEASLPKARGPGPIDRIRNYVQEELKDGEHKLPLAPYDEVLYRPECKEILVDCFNIVNKYREHGFDANASVVNEDLLRLSGNLVHMAGIIGYLNASADHADAQRRLTKSRSYILAKQARDNLDVHLTDGEALELSRTIATPELKNAKAVGLSAATLRTAFYALRSFSEELSRVASRNQKTERGLSYVS